MLIFCSAKNFAFEVISTENSDRWFLIKGIECSGSLNEKGAWNFSVFDFSASLFKSQVLGKIAIGTKLVESFREVYVDNQNIENASWFPLYIYYSPYIKKHVKGYYGENITDGDAAGMWLYAFFGGSAWPNKGVLKTEERIAESYLKGGVGVDLFPKLGKTPFSLAQLYSVGLRAEVISSQRPDTNDNETTFYFSVTLGVMSFLLFD